MPTPHEDRLATALRKVLDSGGHSFQQSVLAHLHRLRDAGASRWVLDVTEFPVATREHSTRIDFVLRCTSAPLLLVAECKRANPGIANWCFVRQAYSGRGFPALRYRVDQIARRNGRLELSGAQSSHVAELFDIGLELKGDEQGEREGGGRGAIEDAIKQVLTGVSGLVNFHAARFDAFAEKEELRFMPVVFTTANLYTSDVPLAAAEIATGRLPAGASTTVKKVDWLLYQYPRSLELGPQLANARSSSLDLAAALEFDMWRTVAVVSPSGVEQALTSIAASL